MTLWACGLLTRDGSDCPAEGVEVLPRPLITVDLVLKFLRHDPLGVHVVQMRQVDQGLSHVLVHVDGVGVLHEFTHYLTLEQQRKTKKSNLDPLLLLAIIMPIQKSVRHIWAIDNACYQKKN